jgi:DivIVA domain-containing protein
MRKKDEAMDGGSEWSAPVGGRVTPQDVQQKEFRVTRLGAGYRMREVDEFLDQITDTLTALIAENDRFRAAGGAVPTPSAPETRRSVAPVRADRGAMDAFLQQEKGFLQELGGLVQAHAEELRAMIRAARTDAGSTATSADAEPPPAAEPELQPVPEPAAQPATSSPAATSEEPSPAADEVEVEAEAEPPQEIDEDADEGDTGTITGVVADEPIRLEEPEPARSSRSDDKESDSLRELFWGEE